MVIELSDSFFDLSSCIHLIKCKVDCESSYSQTIRSIAWLELGLTKFELELELLDWEASRISSPDIY